MIYTKQPSKSHVTSCAQIAHFPFSRHSRDGLVATPNQHWPHVPSPYHPDSTSPLPRGHFLSASSRRWQIVAGDGCSRRDASSPIAHSGGQKFSQPLKILNTQIQNSGPTPDWNNTDFVQIKGGEKGEMWWWSGATFPLDTIMLLQLAVLFIYVRDIIYAHLILMWPHATILERKRRQRKTNKSCSSYCCYLLCYDE